MRRTEAGTKARIYLQGVICVPAYAHVSPVLPEYLIARYIQPDSDEAVPDSLTAKQGNLRTSSLGLHLFLQCL